MDNLSVPDTSGSPTDDCGGGVNGGDEEDDPKMLEERQSLLSTPNVNMITFMVAIVGSVARGPACFQLEPGWG